MRNGIVFIWSEKELLWDLLQVMEKKDFVYVENFVIILLDPTKATGKKETLNTQIVEKANLISEKITKSTNSRSKKSQSSETASFESDTTSHTVSKIPNIKATTQAASSFAEEEKAFLEQLHKYNDLEANNLFLERDSKYFKNSKKTLLMFRKVIDKKEKNLELRHQRTPDVFFTTANPMDPVGNY